jgi:phage repressor protein C with HTH and peptisase S24 domain
MAVTQLAARLKVQMDDTGLNAREIADRASVGRSFIYDILSGKSINPTVSKLAAVAEILGVSVPYLISGEQEEEDYNSGRQNYINIPSVTAHLSPFGKVVVENDSKVMGVNFHKLWIKKYLKTDAASLRITHVRGDAMEPTLCSDDMLLIDMSQQLPTPPGLFVVYDGIGMSVKRLEYIAGSHPASVRIIADNAKYNSYEDSLQNLMIIGRVIWFSREI